LDTLSKTINEYLQSLQNITGMDICYHDYTLKLEQSFEMKNHANQLCLKVKKKNRKGCVMFCGSGGEVDKKIATAANAWLHTCPFGLKKIAVRVELAGALAGVIFATVVNSPDRREDDWYADRCQMLQAGAGYIEKQLQSDTAFSATRKSKIQNHINTHLSESINLGDLAAELNLSPSRTANVVKEIFRKSFTNLINEIKMKRACFLLGSTEMPISDIAQLLGYYDQSHFTRAFIKTQKCQPKHFRNSNHKSSQTLI